MCNETGTTPDIAGLCERLRRKAGFNDPVTGEYVNFPTQPDGPEAADTLERQDAEIERLRGALRDIKALPDMSKNPADDFDRGARAARLDAADMAQADLTGEDTTGSPTSQNTEPGLAFSDAGGGERKKPAAPVKGRRASFG